MGNPWRSRPAAAERRCSGRWVRWAAVASLLVMVGVRISVRIGGVANAMASTCLLVVSPRTAGAGTDELGGAGDGGGASPCGVPRLTTVSQVASFHLVRERPWLAWRAWFRLATEARRIRRLDGVCFVRVLGTGRASSTGPSAAPGRIGIFVVWESVAAAARHERAIADRWGEAHEVWSCRLRPIRATGRWAGQRLDTDGEGGPTREVDGPVVVVTRAAIRWRAMLSFQRASHRMRSAAAAAPGCRAVVGIGEAPLVRLGTFSVWETEATAREFAATHAGHRQAAAAAHDESWFTEELFAWFEPLGSEGSWDGVDPLADVDVTCCVE